MLDERSGKSVHFAKSAHIVSAVLGHSSASFTMGTYQHVRDDIVDPAANALGRLCRADVVPRCLRTSGMVSRCPRPKKGHPRRDSDNRTRRRSINVLV